jgi:phytanoyl-CoA hydroxylase
VQRGLIPEATLATLRDRLQSILDGREPPAPGMLVMRDVMVAKGMVAPERPEEAIAKVQDFAEDPVLFSYVRDPRSLDCVGQIIGGNIQSIHTMLINKPPGVDGRHPLHQDLVYFPFRPLDKIVASQTALESMHRENGCLSVVPRSHERGVREHGDMPWDTVNGGYWGALEVGPHPERVHLEMEPGDTVFFHPLLLHGSGRNRTEGFRRAISSHYASTECVRIWDETEFGDSRQFVPVRGAPPALDPAPRHAPRPGMPAATDFLLKRGKRRAARTENV